ncbi:MAG: hypothetical protein ACKN95_06440, partial [Holophagaceae bacterium]
DLPHPKAAKRAFVIEPLAALVQSYPDAGRIKILASDSFEPEPLKALKQTLFWRLWDGVNLA